MPTTLRGRQGIRLLGPADRAQVEGLLARDPVTNVFVADRVASTGLDQRWLGGRIYGYLEDGELTALCHHAANLVPVRAHRAAVEAFAERAVSDGRSCNSLFGPQDAVLGLWERLQPQWGAARSVRADQPFQCMRAPSAVEPDPAVRVVRLDELDLVYPASVAMFTEEVEISPEIGGGRDLYRTRVRQLIDKGFAFARIEDGEVIFKAEVGAATPYACQVQGVWVNPRYRGRGLSAPGMAAVVAEALRSIAPVVTLYVNADNLAARRVYDKVGFVRTATFATVLL